MRNLWFSAPPIIKILATPMITFMCAVVLLGLFIQKTTLRANKMLNENHLIAYTYCSGLPGYLSHLPHPVCCDRMEINFRRFDRDEGAHDDMAKNSRSLLLCVYG